MYLIPPSEFSKKYIESKEKHMLGIFADISKITKSPEEDEKVPKKQLQAIEKEQKFVDLNKQTVPTQPQTQTQIQTQIHTQNSNPNQNQNQNQNQTQEALLATLVSNPNLLNFLQDPNLQNLFTNPKK